MTLDTMIQLMKQIRDKFGKDVPLYIVDNDHIPITTVSHTELVVVGKPCDPSTYETDETKPVGILMFTH